MIVSPDVNGNMDGSVLRIAREITSHIPIVPITRIEGFKFNPELLELDKYVLLDYSELWWSTDNVDTHLFGKNTDQFPEIYKGEEWAKFDDFVKNNPPQIYFKRELLKKDATDKVVVIDYPCWTEPYPIQTKEQFDARPVNVFFYWGRSSEYRVKLHADFWLNSTKNGTAVCDNLFYLNQFLQEESCPNKWVTVNIAHYSRQPIETILSVNGISKLSVSVKGSGRKCFRHAESPTNSVMVMDRDDLAWAYDWVDGVNCLKINNTSIDELNDLTNRTDLYEIYLNGMANIDNYRINNYVTKYINPLIANL